MKTCPHCQLNYSCSYRYLSPSPNPQVVLCSLHYGRYITAISTESSHYRGVPWAALSQFNVIRSTTKILTNNINAYDRDVNISSIKLRDKIDTVCERRIWVWVWWGHNCTTCICIVPSTFSICEWPKKYFTDAEKSAKTTNSMYLLILYTRLTVPSSRSILTPIMCTIVFQIQVCFFFLERNFGVDGSFTIHKVFRITMKISFSKSLF